MHVISFCFYAGLFAIISFIDPKGLYCTSPDWIRSFSHTTPFCAISGKFSCLSFLLMRNDVAKNIRINEIIICMPETNIDESNAMFFRFCAFFLSNGTCSIVDMSRCSHLLECYISSPSYGIQFSALDEVHPCLNSVCGTRDTSYICCCGVWHWWIYHWYIPSIALYIKKFGGCILRCCFANQHCHTKWSDTFAGSVLECSQGTQLI